MDEMVSGSVTRTFTYGLRPISENQLVNGTWKPSFFGNDGHGNVRFLANIAGTLTDTYQFDAFGNLIASTGATPNPYLYSGERFDTNLNLYHLRARYYNMLTGRFWTMDPEQHKSCCKSPSCSSTSSNAYAYADDDPANRVDPSGRQALEEYELNTVRVAEEVSIKKLAHRECVKVCQEGCDEVIVENPQLDVNFLILCYLTCETACRSIYPF